MYQQATSPLQPQNQTNESKIDIARKLHQLFAHPSMERIIKLLKLSWRMNHGTFSLKYASNVQSKTVF